jgi:hypothetical protein
MQNFLEMRDAFDSIRRAKKESPESLQPDETENFIDRSSINHVRD